MLCSDAIETSENVSYSTANNTSTATAATPASVAGLTSENDMEYEDSDSDSNSDTDSDCRAKRGNYLRERWLHSELAFVLYVYMYIIHVRLTSVTLKDAIRYIWLRTCTFIRVLTQGRVYWGGRVRGARACHGVPYHADTYVYTRSLAHTFGRPIFARRMNIHLP